MDKPMLGIGFRLMTFVFRIRDFFRPRIDFLKEAGIGSGFCVLDFGCGPGSYIQPLAQLVGVSGVIYALDIHPLAIKEVQNKATRNGIKNIKTIESDCNTGLPDNHVDVVLLYDTFHDLSRPDEVMRELYRVLKSTGTLSFSDHHMDEQDILTEITKTGLFKLSAKGKKTRSFSKLGQ
jgi:ubiquinone/menaquinone biosynthesis C-methylase UbiE